MKNDLTLKLKQFPQMSSAGLTGRQTSYLYETIVLNDFPVKEFEGYDHFGSHVHDQVDTKNKGNTLCTKIGICTRYRIPWHF